MKKVLFISNFPPSKVSTGTLLMEQFFRMLPSDSVSCFIINYASLEKEIKLSPEFSSIPYFYAIKPSEHGLVMQNNSFGKLFNKIIYKVSSYRSYLIESIRYRKAKKRILKDVKKFADIHKPDIIWIIIEGQFLIRIAIPISKTLGVPIYTQIWDPPTWWLRDSNVDYITQRITLSEFEKLLKASAKVLTASPNMAKIYNERYGCKAINFLPSLDLKDAFPSEQRSHTDNNEFVIVVTGKIYANKEFNALIHALSDASWKISNRKIILKILAPYMWVEVSSPVHIEFYGWRSQEEALRIINEGDIAYCPYWFDPLFKEESSLSFPAKLTTYLASGRPVFFHGPEYASPALFLKEHNAAICCHSLEAAQIQDALKQVIDDKDLYLTLCVNARKTFDKYLTSESMEKSFVSFLFE